MTNSAGPRKRARSQAGRHIALDYRRRHPVLATKRANYFQKSGFIITLVLSGAAKNREWSNAYLALNNYRAIHTEPHNYLPIEGGKFIPAENVAPAADCKTAAIAKITPPRRSIC